jgi:hypothetical protein
MYVIQEAASASATLQLSNSSTFQLFNSPALQLCNSAILQLLQPTRKQFGLLWYLSFRPIHMSIHTLRTGASWGPKETTSTYLLLCLKLLYFLARKQASKRINKQPP